MAKVGRQRTRFIPERFAIQVEQNPFSHYVYFARDESNGLVKIGSSYGPRLPDRMWELARDTGAAISLLALAEGDHKLEHAYHRLMAVDRDHGEWFRPSVAVMNFLSRHTYWGDWEGF